MTNTATKPTLAIVPTDSPTSALAETKAARDAIAHQLDEIAAAQARIEQAAQPHQQAASKAASLRQKRTGILGRMLNLGRVDMNEAEVVAVDRQLVDAELLEREATAITAARDAALADLQAKRAALLPQLHAAQEAVAVAEFNALGERIAGTMIPNLRAAAAQYGEAYGNLAGAGQAHSEMARRLREQYGVSVQQLGTEWPAQTIDLHPIGFGINDTGNFNVLRIDASAAIEAGRVAALNRG